jgi:hypothetical protein
VISIAYQYTFVNLGFWPDFVGERDALVATTRNAPASGRSVEPSRAPKAGMDMIKLNDEAAAAFRAAFFIGCAV